MFIHVKHSKGLILPQNDINSAVCCMTLSSSMHFDFNSFLAWQRIQFGDNPAGSKGFSRHPCHAFQGKYNKGHSTRRGHLLSATCYIPHSSVSSHSSVHLHSSVNSQLCKFTQPLHMQTAPYSPAGLHTALVRPCSMYLDLYRSISTVGGHHPKMLGPEGIWMTETFG